MIEARQKIFGNSACRQIMIPSSLAFLLTVKYLPISIRHSQTLYSRKLSKIAKNAKNNTKNHKKIISSEKHR